MLRFRDLFRCYRGSNSDVNWSSTNHQMLLAQVRGPQKSINPLWNNATISSSPSSTWLRGRHTTWVFHQHSRRRRQLMGKFEGAVVPVGGGFKCDGYMAAQGGDRNYAGVSGEGTFSMRMTSPKP